MKERQENEDRVLRARAGDEKAIGELVAASSAMIRRQAERYRVPGMEQEDFEQEGRLGLLKAIRLYRPEKSGFSTFASLCVSSAMASAAREALSARHRPLFDYAPLEEVPEPDSTDPSDAPLEELVSHQEEAEEWKNKMETLLTAYERQVLKAYLGGRTYTEIASGTSSSAKAVDNALQRVRKKLRGA